MQLSEETLTVKDTIEGLTEIMRMILWLKMLVMKIRHIVVMMVHVFQIEHNVQYYPHVNQCSIDALMVHVSIH